MTESTSVSECIRCPGCHFECMLVKYQCGRGKEFYDIAAAGGEVPVRRGPMMTPSERAASPDGKPPLDNQVMHALNIVASRLRDRHIEAGERKIVVGLARAESFMSVLFLAKRSQMSIEELEGELEKACTSGFVCMEDDEHTGRIARLTDAGTEQAAQWEMERNEQTAAFLSALSDEEKRRWFFLFASSSG